MVEELSSVFFPSIPVSHLVIFALGLFRARAYLQQWQCLFAWSMLCFHNVFLHRIFNSVMQRFLINLTEYRQLR